MANLFDKMYRKLEQVYLDEAYSNTDAKIIAEAIIDDISDDQALSKEFRVIELDTTDLPTMYANKQHVINMSSTKSVTMDSYSLVFNIHVKSDDFDLESDFNYLSDIIHGKNADTYRFRRFERRTADLSDKATAIKQEKHMSLLTKLSYAVQEICWHRVANKKEPVFNTLTASWKAFVETPEAYAYHDKPSVKRLSKYKSTLDGIATIQLDFLDGNSVSNINRASLPVKQIKHYRRTRMPYADVLDPNSFSSGTKQADSLLATGLLDPGYNQEVLEITDVVKTGLSALSNSPTQSEIEQVIRTAVAGALDKFKKDYPDTDIDEDFSSIVLKIVFDDVEYRENVVLDSNDKELKLEKQTLVGNTYYSTAGWAGVLAEMIADDISSYINKDDEIKAIDNISIYVNEVTGENITKEIRQAQQQVNDNYVKSWSNSTDGSAGLVASQQANMDNWLEKSLAGAHWWMEASMAKGGRAEYTGYGYDANLRKLLHGDELKSINKFILTDID